MGRTPGVTRVSIDGTLFIGESEMLADERVVRRDGVVPVTFLAVHVDPEDAPQEVLGYVLPVLAADGVVPVVDVALALVVAGTAVTDRDVEVAVGSA